MRLRPGLGFVEGPSLYLTTNKYFTAKASPETSPSQVISRNISVTQLDTFDIGRLDGFVLELRETSVVQVRRVC